MPTQQEILAAIESLERHCQAGLKMCRTLKIAISQNNGPVTVAKPSKSRQKPKLTPAMLAARFRERQLSKSA